MNSRFVTCLFGLGLLSLLSAGCSHTSLRSSRPEPRCLPAALAAEFSYVKQSECPWQEQVVEEKNEYRIRRIAVLISGETTNAQRKIEFDYYDLAQTGPTPVIMVLPMLGGGYSLERHFAAYFASRGYASVIVRRDKRTKSARLEDLNRLLREMVIDHKRVIDWLEAQPDIDATRLGVFGVSMGGIKAALLVPLEERIQAAALGLCGGDLPYILTRTTETGLVKRRDQELQAQNLTLEQAEQKLRSLLTCDPIRYAPYVDPRKVLLVLARYDTVVPIEKGLELKEKMGHPETIMIPAGHYSAVVSIPYIKTESFQFFQRRFAESALATAKANGDNARSGQTGGR
jgi:hypothetical protein